jgi:eukaryotic translation initiation factor 2C
LPGARAPFKQQERPQQHQQNPQSQQGRPQQQQQNPQSQQGRPQQQQQNPQSQQGRPQQQQQNPQSQQGRPQHQQTRQQEKPQQSRPAPSSSSSAQSFVQPEQKRPQTESTGAVAKQMSQMSLAPGKSLRMIESAPDGRVYEGTRGRKCNLEVNYLKICVDKLLQKAFHYDVEFDPPTPKKLLGRALDTFMTTHFSNIHFAFDGRKNFYTNQLLSVNGDILNGEFVKEVMAVLGDRSRNFKVKVKFATEVDMSVLKAYQNPAYQYNDKPSQAIQCLDVILRTVFKTLTANNQATAVGRALYFAPEGRPIDLTEGMELWLGLFQSAVLGRKSLYLNVDVAHKAFPSSMSLLSVLASFDRNGQIPERLNHFQEEQLNNYLKMLSISYRPVRDQPLKTFGFNGLVKPANQAQFVDEDGTKMTVQQYFQQKKNIQLRYPNLPCLHVGSRVRNIYLPLELCEIPAGQATNKKCTPNAVAAMIKYSATSTDERKAKIRNLLNRINYSQPGSEVQGFGIGVDNRNFQNVEGRVIDPPQLMYRDGPVTPRCGVWNGKKFLETQGEQIKWAIINCDDRTTVQTIVELKGNILKGAAQQGMNLFPSQGNNDYFALNMMRARPGELEALLEKCSKAQYKIVFVIIIDRNDCYAQVKQAAELKVGILTQCIKANTVFRMNGRGGPMMTIGNIMLKVNAKLNGKNQEVVEPSYQKYNSLSDGVMFVGGDVTHPSPDQRDVPSVVGVACSYDQVGFRYQCAWRLQHPTKEMIEDLENILVEHLKFYQQKNGKLPGKIMYYRDGVSEGQFAEVLSIEMTAIRAAMKKIYGTKDPAKVTFIVVQKRHHTRFFPTQKQFRFVIFSV